VVRYAFELNLKPTVNLGGKQGKQAPWRRVNFERLIVAEMVKKFPAIRGPRDFIKVHFSFVLPFSSSKRFLLYRLSYYNLVYSVCMLHARFVILDYLSL
jgi:hypothetical protein